MEDLRNKIKGPNKSMIFIKKHWLKILLFIILLIIILFPSIFGQFIGMWTSRFMISLQKFYIK